MKISYYTVDDLRLGHDPKGVFGWRLSRFLDWRDALEHYRSLPDNGVKALGVSSGEQDLELMRHIPITPDGEIGLDIALCWTAVLLYG